MSERKIKLIIEGQEIICNFGINYFYKHFEKITGIDMLVEGLKGLATTKMFDLIPSLYYSGYIAECSKNKEEPKLIKDVFDHYVLSSDESVAADMIRNYLNLVNPKEEEKTGEPAAQTTELMTESL